MDRKTFAFTLLILAAVLLAGCSQVFEAGISGKVVTRTEGGTSEVALADVNVFAYTDKNLRDSDYVLFVEKKTTRPSEGAGYVATSLTNERGEFVVNKIVWETKDSKYGKTADVNKLYLIFYHKDYDPAKYDATIISGSTNSDNVYVSLNGNKDYSTINVTVRDVTRNLNMSSNVTLEYWVNADEDVDPETIVVAGGNTSFQISYDKGTAATVSLRVRSNGTHWKMVDNKGSIVEDPILFNVGSGTTSAVLYMRNDELILPGFSGDISGMITINNPDPDNEYDNKPVWVEYKDKNGAWIPFEETVSANHRTQSTRTIGDSILYTHGVFSNIGSDGYTVTINKDTYPDIRNWDVEYQGKAIPIEIRLAFLTDSTDPSDLIIKYYEFIYTNTSGSNADLGHINPKEETTP